MPQILELARMSTIVSTLSVTAALTLSGSQAATGAQNLEITRQVTRNVLTSTVPALQIRVESPFQYVGGQRFILRDVADAEQHVFVDADASKVIRRMYWIQFEQYLPGKAGEYNYDSDAAQSAWGLSWRVHVRRFADPPAAGSDRERVHQLVERHGFSVPLPFVRARLVHVPASNKREEVMIIYLEPAGGEPSAADRQSLTARAMKGLHLLQTSPRSIIR
jgi:hypothetical protein